MFTFLYLTLFFDRAGGCASKGGGGGVAVRWMWLPLGRLLRRVRQQPAAGGRYGCPWDEEKNDPFLCRDRRDLFRVVKSVDGREVVLLCTGYRGVRRKKNVRRVRRRGERHRWLVDQGRKGCGWPWGASSCSVHAQPARTRMVAPGKMVMYQINLVCNEYYTKSSVNSEYALLPSFWCPSAACCANPTAFLVHFHTRNTIFV